MDIPLSLDRYLPHLKETFTLQGEGGVTATLTLTEAKSRIDDEVQCCFSLIFIAKEGEVLPQHLYRLSHPALGEFDLFLVPIQKRKTGVVYQAVFNLLKEDAQ